MKTTNWLVISLAAIMATSSGFSEASRKATGEVDRLNYSAAGNHI